MHNLVERIAHYADIDTRRAMGFTPLKLTNVPKLDLHFEKFGVQDNGVSYISFKKDGIITSITHHPEGVPGDVDIMILRRTLRSTISDIAFSYSDPFTYSTKYAVNRIRDYS